jgi:hypothetical protein
MVASETPTGGLVSTFGAVGVSGAVSSTFGGAAVAAAPGASLASSSAWGGVSVTVVGPAGLEEPVLGDVFTAAGSGVAGEAGVGAVGAGLAAGGWACCDGPLLLPGQKNTAARMNRTPAPAPATSRGGRGGSLTSGGRSGPPQDGHMNGSVSATMIGRRRRPTGQSVVFRHTPGVFAMADLPSPVCTATSTDSSTTSHAAVCPSVKKSGTQREAHTAGTGWSIGAPGRRHRGAKAMCQCLS